MIGSDDPEALMLMDEMIRYLTQPTTSTATGNVVVFAIKYANAADVARTLDELYNGRQQRQGGGGGQQMNPFQMLMQGRMGGGGGGPFGGGDPTGGGGGGDQGGRTRAFRGQRGPRRRGSPLELDHGTHRMELVRIRTFLEEWLDTADPDSEALRKTYLLGPLQNARREQSRHHLANGLSRCPARRWRRRRWGRR